MTCDFSVQQDEIAAMAGLPVRTWQAEYDRIEPWLTDGRLTKTQAFGDILRTCVRIAIVSNCGETTRPLLVKLGVDVLADVLVLSCEAGSAKPDARIFTRALDQLGARPEAAVFVDDQARYCAGAVAVGIAAAQIVRGEPNGKAPAVGTTVVRSLPEVQAMFTG